MEEIKYCADILGQCDHESCAIAISRELWADMAMSWTADDSRWLRRMRRSVTIRRKLRRFQAWVQRGL